MIRRTDHRGATRDSGQLSACEVFFAPALTKCPEHLRPPAEFSRQSGGSWLIGSRSEYKALRVHSDEHSLPFCTHQMSVFPRAKIQRRRQSGQKTIPPAEGIEREGRRNFFFPSLFSRPPLLFSHFNVPFAFFERHTRDRGI